MNTAGPHFEMDQKRARLLAEVRRHAPSREGVFRRSFTTRSLRAAITAKCLECCGFTVRHVRECGDTSCPNWNCRPYQSGNPEQAEPAKGRAGSNDNGRNT